MPNFSEGRDLEKVAAIVARARGIAGVTVLDVESNADHNRSVVSLVGESEPLLRAVFGMIETAIATIDLNHHVGEHPRMGAVDVVPFIPLGDATTAEAVTLAEQLAERVWNGLHLPVYLYAQAARVPERSDLAVVRKGGFEGIRAEIATEPRRRPDFGDPAVHPTAGIVAIGARPVLIAYNAYLTTPDVSIAKKIAHAVRGRDGGLPEVKALGFEIKERNQAQVSMNLTDYRKTPMHQALEAVRREAERHGVRIDESEIVGLVPEDALLDASEYYLQLHHFDRAAILERKVRAANSDLSPSPGPLADRSIRSFTDALAARTPTPGGGSAAAAAGAMGAALGAMVLAYSIPTGSTDSELIPLRETVEASRARFLTLIDEDVSAYEGVRAARKARKADPVGSAADWVGALRRAASVPLETAELARSTARRLDAVRSRVKPAILSDLTSALALLRAAEAGAVSNVEINLADIRTEGASTTEFDARLSALRGAA